ncbi:MAG: HD-GYP domain-containing protein [Clostridium sp.]|uniref:HD-GYP domain-containing protein n=1 Tax=Clostridium sp. TaxID=1506 RepID=UPI0039ECE44A
MEKKKKILSVEDLEAGMITVNEIKSDGIILVAKGVQLTERVINTLKEKYIYSKVEVYYEEYESISESLKNIEDNFIELTFDLQRIFKHIDRLQVSDIEEIRKFSIKIKNELKSTDSIIKNIVLYGSGKDSIYRHGVNVAALSSILGKWIGLDEIQLNLLNYAAILHDFGKTKISDNIINKVGQLTDSELKKIRMHPVTGYEFINKIPFLDRSVGLAILMHHEREDGSGYPFGIKDNKIHPFAKIIAIADVFDAVNSNRGYRNSRGPFEALEIIKEDSLGKLDYNYCTIFLNHVINYYMGESVLLNNDKIYKIIQVNKNDFQRPLLLADNEFLDLRNNKDLYVKQLILNNNYI